jgi:precorrin-4 C11-methyltransferase
LKTAIIATTDRATDLGGTLQRELPGSRLFTTRAETSSAAHLPSITEFVRDAFRSYEALVFIGALGICVRTIAPHLQDKRSDPAVVNLDDHASFVQAVVGGHTGGANALSARIARITGAQAVVTTSSDLQGIWPLDMLAPRYNWTMKRNRRLNELIALFVNHHKTALLLDVNDRGTAFLERTKPDFVTVVYSSSDIPDDTELVVTVSHKRYAFDKPHLQYIPKVLSVGSGCSRHTPAEPFREALAEAMGAKGFELAAVREFGSIDLKANEDAYLQFAETLDLPFRTFHADEIRRVEVPNPSEITRAKVGVDGVAEAAAMLLSGNNTLVVEKTKVKLASGHMFTFAVALDRQAERRGKILIVGAGPGDAELISVKGRRALEQADCILYAGSLIPEALTQAAKERAVVRNSAIMTLEGQMELMREHYLRGHLIVRLQSGDPALYGAIQEQMTIFDEYGMDYEIIPGISAYAAAAAVLKSEFTIPEVVQSIILTRGEGKTPMPPTEKLLDMAKHRATMCIFLSARIVKRVQRDLMAHYPADTKVAVLYRISWEDEQVWTGELRDLERIVKENKLTRTTLIVVGDAIGARKNRSKLYDASHKHIFRAT